MCKREIPRGHVLLRIEDLAALLAAQSSPVTATAELPAPDGDAWAGLAVAIAMVTARLGHHDADPGQLADETDAASIIRPLVAMAAEGLRGCLPEDGAQRLLQDMGLIAASRGIGPDGRKL